MADATRRGLVGSSRRQASSQGGVSVSVTVAAAVEAGERRGVAAAFVVEVGDGESRLGGCLGGAGGAVGEGAPFNQSVSVILLAPPHQALGRGDGLVVIRG